MVIKIFHPDELEEMMVDQSDEKYVICFIGDGAMPFISKLENLFFAPGTPAAKELGVGVLFNEYQIWETWLILPRTKKNLKRIVYVTRKLGIEYQVGKLVNDLYPELKRELDKKAGKSPELKPVSERKREPIPSSVQKEVYIRDGGKCTNCDSTEKLHFDHIIPVSKGGSNVTDNIQILCQKCNLRKGSKIGGEK